MLKGIFNPVKLFILEIKKFEYLKNTRRDRFTVIEKIKIALLCHLLRYFSINNPFMKSKNDVNIKIDIHIGSPQA
ncbi:MAG: hypothetical protein ACM3UU_06275 [Ignavibacteriales bacterium]